MAPFIKDRNMQVVGNILNILLNDKSLYVVDGCSGGGSCGLACISLGIKCGIFEKSGIVIL